MNDFSLKHVTHLMLWWWAETFPSCGFLYNSNAEPLCSRLPAKSNDGCCGGILPNEPLRSDYELTK